MAAPQGRVATSRRTKPEGPAARQAHASQGQLEWQFGNARTSENPITRFGREPPRPNFRRGWPLPRLRTTQPADAPTRSRIAEAVLLGSTAGNHAVTHLSAILPFGGPRSSRRDPLSLPVGSPPKSHHGERRSPSSPRATGRRNRMASANPPVASPLPGSVLSRLRQPETKIGTPDRPHRRPRGSRRSQRAPRQRRTESGGGRICSRLGSPEAPCPSNSGHVPPLWSFSLELTTVNHGDAPVCRPRRRSLDQS